MGNDGGSIPTRRELVKEAARNPTTTELKEAQHEQQEYYWTTDPLSRRPLARPIVSDSSGKLYNKDAIIEYLLPSDDGASKAEAEKVLHGAVKSLKDVVEVKFEVAESEGKNGTSKGERFVCPVTNDALGPTTKAVYLVPCGHAFSANAIKEITSEKCIQCEEPYAPNDVIPIIPTATDDVARLSLRIKTLQEKGLTHSLKKASGGGKKRKKNGEKNVADSKDAPQLVPASVPAKPSSGIKHAETAALTAKVLKEQSAATKKRKLEEDDPIKKLYSSRDPSKPHGKSSDFMTRGFSIK